MLIVIKPIRYTICHYKQDKERIMEAGKRTISDIFNKARILRIPFFQRGYVWNQDNWSRFLEDMIEVSKNNKDYFLGSSILKAEEVPSNEKIGDRRSVVDGQQRLTTIVLFFKVLTEIQSNPEFFKDVFYNYQKQMILKHNHMDTDIFDAIVYDRLTDELKEKYKENNILKCYEYFNIKRDEILKIDLSRLISHLYFVGIDLNKDEDEQQIFDTINSLGVRLTTAELLKNYLFTVAEDSELYTRTWKEVFEKDEDTRCFWDQEITSGRTKRTNIDVLLQSYFFILKGNNDFKVSDLFQEYKRYIDENNIKKDICDEHGNSLKENFVNDLIDYARLYREYIDYMSVKHDIDPESYIQRINIVIFALEMTTLIPYVLYILHNVKDLESQNQIFKFLENYIIRRLICQYTTKNYNNLFASLVGKKISTVNELKQIVMDSNSEIDKYPTDDEINIKFENVSLSHKIAKGILYLLELTVRSNRHQTLLKGIEYFDLEHILPQNWRDNWQIEVTDNEDINKKEAERDILLRTIGNLTILTGSLNRSIKNADWNTKKNGNGKKDGLKIYAEGIETFSPYLELSDWDETSIKNRSSYLKEKFFEVWK